MIFNIFDLFYGIFRSKFRYLIRWMTSGVLISIKLNSIFTVIVIIFVVVVFISINDIIISVYMFIIAVTFIIIVNDAVVFIIFIIFVIFVIFVIVVIIVITNITITINVNGCSIF